MTNHRNCTLHYYFSLSSQTHTHTHHKHQRTHTPTYPPPHRCVFVCVCVCMCESMFVSGHIYLEDVTPEAGTPFHECYTPRICIHTHMYTDMNQVEPTSFHSVSWSTFDNLFCSCILYSTTHTNVTQLHTHNV
jgi:hypothetical protein